MAYYLGFDSSTQSLTAIVIDADERRVVFESSIGFDETFPQYGTDHGVLPRSAPDVAVSSPLMWVEALDAMMARIKASGLDMQGFAAISGSAQQHGSVYLNARARKALGSLEPGQALPAQIEPLLSRPVSPIWMDSSTGEECAEITAAVGGADVLARRTGSRAFERFTRGDHARTRGGAGLGLAIVRAIAEAHGGRVELDTREGAGATFTLIVPTEPPREDGTT
jgi:xylulokinase